MRILIAEDETIIRLDLRDMLVRAGFEVCAEARDGDTTALDTGRGGFTAERDDGGRGGTAGKAICCPG